MKNFHLHEEEDDPDFLEDFGINLIEIDSENELNSDEEAAKIIFSNLNDDEKREKLRSVHADPYVVVQMQEAYETAISSDDELPTPEELLIMEAEQYFLDRKKYGFENY